MEFNQDRYQRRTSRLIPRRKRTKPMRFVFAGLLVMIAVILLSYLIMVKGILKQVIAIIKSMV